nr:MAG TPA: tail protein [Caudoviricetes sp.]
MWDLISYRVYGSEKYVKILLEANPVYRNIAIFPADIDIICPVIPSSESRVLPPWKR